MGLGEYRRKRAINKTPEPFGGTELPTMSTGTFVVQLRGAARSL
jgi:hypothetical protein